MARKIPKIKTRSWVMYKGELTEVKDLPEEYQVYLASWIKATVLNEFYAGKAVFTPACPDPRESGGARDGTVQA